MRRLLALVAGSLLVLSACGQSEVDTAQLEEQVTTQLTESVGEAPDDVSCPDPLPAEVDASVTCLLTAGEAEYDVEVTTTEVEDDQVGFDIQVAEEPN